MSPKLLSSLFEFKAWADADLLSALERVPADQGVTLRGCLHWLEHIHRVDSLFQAVLEGAPRPFDSTFAEHTPDLERLRPAMLATDAWYVEHVAGFAPERLGEVLAFTFTDGDRGSMSREEILLHVLTHGVYHRGNVGQLMMSASLAPPRDVLAKFLHAREPARRTAGPLPTAGPAASA